MLRTLNIELFENLNVDYKFSRSGFKSEINEYLIEYSDEKTIIHETKNLKTDNFIKQVEPIGIKLNWNKRQESQNSSKQRYLHYTKLGYMKLYQENPKIIRYRESFKIKGNNNSIRPSTYVISLHNVNRRLSAINSMSTAIFYAHSNGYTHTCYTSLTGKCSEHNVKIGDALHLRPIELKGCKFYCKGILEVDWFLEIDEKYVE